MARCRVCHKPLSDPHSIEREIGPVCERHWGDAQQASLVDYDRPYGGGDVRLWRDGSGRACANVPHALVRHSPDGYEWGYSGSGPADLALNILLAVDGDTEWCERWHQKFKEQFIASIPENGGVITRAEIDRFLLENS